MQYNGHRNPVRMIKAPILTSVKGRLSSSVSPPALVGQIEASEVSDLGPLRNES